MIEEMPNIGTMVRRKRDGNIYTVGLTTKYMHGEYVTLIPVWSGRVHEKSVTHFLCQFSLNAK